MDFEIKVKEGEVIELQDYIEPKAVINKLSPNSNLSDILSVNKQISKELENQRNTVKEMLVNKGVEVEESDKLTTLINKIPTIKGFPTGWDVEKSGRVITQDAIEGDAGVWLMGGQLEEMPDETLGGKLIQPLRFARHCKVRKHTNGKTYLYSVDADYYLTIFELVEGLWVQKATQLQTTISNSYNVMDVTPDGELIVVNAYSSGSTIKKLKTWDGENIVDVGNVNQDETYVTYGASISPQKDIMLTASSSSGIGRIRLLDNLYNSTKTGSYLDGKSLTLHGDSCFSKDGNWLVIVYCQASENVLVFKRNETKEYKYEFVQTLTCSGGNASNVSMSDDGSVFAVSSNLTSNNVNIFKRTGETYSALSVPNFSQASSYYITVSPDGTKVISSANALSLTRVYTVNGNVVELNTSSATDYVFFGDWINNKEFVAGTYDTYTKSLIFEEEYPTSFNPKYVYRHPIDPFAPYSYQSFSNFSFDDSGEYMVATYKNSSTNRTHDFAIYKKIPERNVYCLAKRISSVTTSYDSHFVTISPNGKYILAPRNGNAGVVAYLLGQGESVTRLDAPSKNTSSAPLQVSWSPDNSHVAIVDGGSASQLTLYKVDGDTFTKVATPFTGYHHRGVAFSPDGKYIVTSTSTSTTTEVHLAELNVSTGLYELIHSTGSVITGRTLRIHFIADTYKFIVSSEGSKNTSFCEIDASTKKIKVLSSNCPAVGIEGITADGKFIYGIDYTRNINSTRPLVLYSVDSISDNLTYLWHMPLQYGLGASQVSPNGGFLMLCQNSDYRTAGTSLTSNFEVPTEPRVLAYNTLNLPYVLGSHKNIGVISKGAKIGETATVNCFPKLNIGGVKQMIQRINMLENRIMSLEESDKAILRGDMQTVAYNNYPEDFEDIKVTNQDIATLEER